MQSLDRTQLCHFAGIFSVGHLFALDSSAMTQKDQHNVAARVIQNDIRVRDFITFNRGTCIGNDQQTNALRPIVAQISRLKTPAQIKLGGRFEFCSFDQLEIGYPKDSVNGFL